MKSNITVDIDTERKVPIIINKPENIEPQPTNKEEAKVMVNNDIKCLTEALCFLIKVGSDNEYLDSNEVTTQTIIRLNKLLK
jgi:hypothetical protein